MRTMSQMNALERLPQDNMARKIILKILHTPKPDYAKLHEESLAYEKELIASMPVEEQKKT